MIFLLLLIVVLILCIPDKKCFDSTPGIVKHLSEKFSTKESSNIHRNMWLHIDNPTVEFDGNMGLCIDTKDKVRPTRILATGIGQTGELELLGKNSLFKNLDYSKNYIVELSGLVTKPDNIEVLFNPPDNFKDYICNKNGS